MGIFTMNYRGIISLLVFFNRIPYLKTIYWRKNLSIWWCMAKYIWIEVMQISTISSHLYKSTFATHGQVVSTIWTFFSLKVNISSTAAPKAGNMTTSPLLTTSNCFPPSSRGIFWTFISSSRCINNLSMLKNGMHKKKGQLSTIEFRIWINFYQLPELFKVPIQKIQDHWW